MMYETCPRSSLGNMEMVLPAKILNTVLFSIILWSVVTHLQAALTKGKIFFRMYLFWMIFILLQLGIAMYVPTIKVHLHHAHWGWLLAHYAQFPDRSSENGQAMFIALFLHGSTVFGVEPIFLSNETNNTTHAE